MRQGVDPQTALNNVYQDYLRDFNGVNKSLDDAIKLGSRTFGSDDPQPIKQAIQDLRSLPGMTENKLRSLIQSGPHATNKAVEAALKATATRTMSIDVNGRSIPVVPPSQGAASTQPSLGRIPASTQRARDMDGLAAVEIERARAAQAGLSTADHDREISTLRGRLGVTGPTVTRVTNDADWERLPSGARFITPDGRSGRKP